MSIEVLVASGAIELASRSVQSMRGGVSTGAINTAKNVVGSANSSLIDVAARAIVEPMVLVDTTVAQHESANDIMQACLSLFAGYYIQSLSLVATVGGVEAGDRLGRFNPNRSTSMESLDGKPSPRRRLHGVNSLAMEDAWTDMAQTLATTKTKIDQPAPAKVDGGDKAGVSERVLTDLRESVNLSVGRMFTVNLAENGQTVSIPVAIRLLVSQMTDEQMRNFFTFRTTFDLDMKERWHGYRAGRLKFWRDLVLCNDLIDKYRKAALRDKSGVTAEQLRRESSNISASLKDTKNVSLATAANIVVMSSATASGIESELGGSLDSTAVRKSVFENTNLMILVVVDSYHDIVKFYHRGVSMPSTLTTRDIKASNRNGGPDVADIMRTYLLGNAPMGR